MRKRLLIAVVLLILATGVGCQTQAEKVSRNLSLEADNFNIVRQLTVMSLFTNDTLFRMTGKISIQPYSDRLEVTVQHEGGNYRKHFIHLGDNLTYIVEDLGLGANDVSNYKYTLNYNPKMWIPVDIKTID